MQGTVQGQAGVRVDPAAPLGGGGVGERHGLGQGGEHGLLRALVRGQRGGESGHCLARQGLGQGPQGGGVGERAVGLDGVHIGAAVGHGCPALVPGGYRPLGGGVPEPVVARFGFQGPGDDQPVVLRGAGALGDRAVGERPPVHRPDLPGSGQLLAPGPAHHGLVGDDGGTAVGVPHLDTAVQGDGDVAEVGVGALTCLEGGRVEQGGGALVAERALGVGRYLMQGRVDGEPGEGRGGHQHHR